MPINARGAAAGRIVKASLLFLAGFLLVGQAVRRAAPDPLVSDKLRYFELHRDEYDSLFIGDSKIYREIVPPRFDAVLRAAGVENRSFNMGLPGMDPYELHYLLAGIARLRPKRLKYVFVGIHSEPSGPLNQKGPANFRNIYWHTPEETAAVAAGLLAGPRENRLELLYDNAAFFAYNLLDRGRLSDALRGTDDDLADSWRRNKIDRWQGYFPLEMDGGEDFIAQHQRFVRGGSAAFESEAAQWEAAQTAPYDPIWYAPQERAFDAIRETAASRRWKLLFLGAIYGDAHARTGCETPSAGCAVVEFNDRRRYADLYRRDAFYDFFHLRREPALKYTELAARRVLELKGFIARP